jgi:hypothetical protein
MLTKKSFEDAPSVGIPKKSEAPVGSPMLRKGWKTLVWTHTEVVGGNDVVYSVQGTADLVRENIEARLKDEHAGPSMKVTVEAVMFSHIQQFDVAVEGRKHTLNTMQPARARQIYALRLLNAAQIEALHLKALLPKNGEVNLPK